MNDYVRIIVYENSDLFQKYLINNKIYYKDLIKSKDYYLLTVCFNDYKKINRRYNSKLIRYYGKSFIVNIIKKHKYMIISLIISLLMLNMLTNTIFMININTNDQNIRKIVEDALTMNDISIYKRKKSFKKIEEIKDKILDENEEYLEWIEISEKGCIYNIDVTPRVKKNNNVSNDSPSDIVASKDGKILFITSSRGIKLKDKNDYVKKGEVLISGNIMKDDEVIYQVSSKGKVYAEVWYTVNITVPFNYIEYVDTNKVINHYYLDVFGHKFTLTGKYESNNTINNTKLILDKPYLPFKLYKEEKRKYEYKEFNINEEEAYKEAIKRSDNKIQNMLDSDEYIISKNVLKKEVFSSKIKLEVFYKVYENIGITSNIESIKE